MKIPRRQPRTAPQRRRADAAGFTLPELMIATAIFVMTAAGFLGIHVYGLRMNQLVEVKLGASDDARRALGRLVDDVRTAGVVRVGNGDADLFAEVPTGEPQQGNALQVYPSKSDPDGFVRYFLDPTDRQLRRMESGGDTILVLAHAVTNALVFASESHTGTVLTNNLNNRVIGVSLQFYQIPAPNMTIGPGQYYDFYQLRTKITRRALE